MRAAIAVLFLSACGAGAQSTTGAAVGNCTIGCPPCPSADQCLPGYNLSGYLPGCTTSMDCGRQ